MKKKQFWPKMTLLLLTLSGLAFLNVFSLVGLGCLTPNLGFHSGYYGRFNRIIDRIEASPGVEVIRTSLHRDVELEDFYITVQMQDDREVLLNFEGANERPYSELVQELKRVGI
jgi:hypothetical protein